MNIAPYLEDLEKRIEPETEEALRAQWKAFLDGRTDDAIFSPRRSQPSPSDLDWPNVPVNDALDDPDLMVLQQLSLCSAELSAGSGAILNVRPNYGTGILPSVFGAEMFRMDPALNTLPGNLPLPGGADAVRACLDRAVPDPNTGLGERCLTLGRLLTDRFAPYPNVSRHVRLYHPDLQGPMDVCELLWGSDLFYALADTPDLVKAFLNLITETYIRFMRAWEAIVPPRENGYAAHWGLLIKGRIMLRDDSAMNLSPAMFDEFIAPYDRRLLAELGGGAIHFCGRGDHYIDRLPAMPGLHSVNLSQPEYNAMDRIFEHTIHRGLTLLGLARPAAEAAMRAGRNLRGRVHCRQ